MLILLRITDEVSVRIFIRQNLAFKYAQFSERTNFREEYLDIILRKSRS